MQKRSKNYRAQSHELINEKENKIDSNLRDESDTAALKSKTKVLGKVRKRCKIRIHEIEMENKILKMKLEDLNEVIDYLIDL